MAMATCADSPVLEYPDSDGEQEQQIDQDEQDQLEAMAAMEEEARLQKKGQVIQHRHISPPLPSSSQLPDTPAKLALERLNKQLEWDDDIVHVERLTSPPAASQIPAQVVSNDKPSQPSTTPLGLGGSTFRRKTVMTTDLSSSPAVSKANENTELSNASPFEDLDIVSVPGTPTSMSSPPPQDNSPASNIPPLSTRITLTAYTSSGKEISISKKPAWKKVIANQQRQDAIREQRRSYYGVDIHGLMDKIDTPSRSIPTPSHSLANLGAKPAQQLWTDKYRATKFVDLLGDERIHRDIMRWLKHWDYCVFGRPIPQSSNYTNNTYTNKQQGPSKLSQTNGKAFTPAAVVDPYQRPQQRILMLHGPPGLGKTTLAHVAATLAGYEVLEINASDDRSGSAARDKIVEAVETLGLDRSGGRGKERCVVLDECDGGDANFVRVLLDLIHADEKAGGPPPKNSKGRKKLRKPLVRPIICICNDLYAPALRPLRPYCHVLHIRPTPSSNLIPRLQKICVLEGLKVDVRALTLLADSNDGDLRACLNNLQLLATKCNHLTIQIVQESLEKAKKEGSLTSHDVVEGIFYKRTAKERRRLNISTENEADRVINDVHACGEYERIISGCHTHFLTQSYSETHLDKTCQAYEWLNLYDRMQNAVYQDQLGECLAYIPYSAQGFHELFAQEKPTSQKSLERKRDSWEAYEKQKQNREIVDGWIAALEGRMKQMFNRNDFAEEFISLVLRIISPDLKPVNEQLITPPERLALHRVVDAMIQTGLKYTQYRVDDGSFVFKLEPSGIEDLVSFGSESKSIRGRYAVRQLVSREMEREKIRRRKGDFAEPDVEKGPKRGRDETEQGPKKVIVERVKKDFFGRVIAEETDQGKRRRVDTFDGVKVQPNVWVKFHEGYSNAVRKPVLFADLLGRV